MADVCWVSFILLLGVIHCYENLSRRSTTTLSQSSTYKDRHASYANDNELRTFYTYCAHTAPGHSKAWFQVDLGKEYSIKSVKIYHRKEDDEIYDWKQYRFKKFYLDVSNSSAAVTTTTQRTRCYTDTSPDGALPDNIIDLPCKQTARYIIVETTYDAPEDDPTTGAILEICEIEVYGCEIGKYGDGCWNCSGCETCDVIGGVCTSVACSDNCVSGLCNSTTGYCSNGCIQGRYGNRCEHNCNVNCLGNTCVQNSGVCTNGCDDSYYGDKCEYQCSSHCSPRSCDRYNGTCTGCSDGYHGLSCRDVCSVNCAEGTCDQQTGRCDRGCQANWDGDQCDNYQQSSTKSCDNTVAIVSIVLSVIIVLTGSIINVLWWRRNHALNTKKGIKENVDSQTRAHGLTEIPNSDNPYENPVRSDYAELGELDKPNAYDELHKYTEAVKNI